MKVDDQVRALINEINFNDLIKLLNNNTEIGAMLVSFLNASQMAKLFETLDTNTVTKISEAGMALRPNVIQENMKQLKELLLHTKMQSKKLSDFGEKVQAILKVIQIEKEEALFKALSLQMDKAHLIELAKVQLPSELIPQLPQDLLRRALNTLPLTTRAEFIISQKSPRREFILNLISGGKNKEIIEEEIDTIQLDQLKVTSLQRSSEKYWKQYVLIIRTMIEKDESIQAELFPVLSSWADRLTQSQRGAYGIRAA
jgi:hypothetical protein